MRKRIVWLILSCLMVASLLLVSCGPAAEEEEEVVTPEEEVVPPPEGLEHRGVLRITRGSSILGFDDTTFPRFLLTTLQVRGKKGVTL